MDKLIEQLKALLNRYRIPSEGLAVSERDKKTLVLGLAAGGAIVLYIVFQIFSSGAAKLEKQAEVLAQDLSKIDALRSDYSNSTRKIEDLTKKITTANEDLVSLAEKSLIESQIERGSFSINSRTPVSADLYDEKIVDVEIRRVSLDRAVGVLYKIQSKPTFLKLSKFSIRTRFDNPNLVDVSFRISAFEFKQGV
ncbi:MAG: hypothetical protein ACT4NX_06345 [Deltaproteobacteria bacterium]